MPATVNLVKPMQTHKKHRGITLVELMATVSVAAITLGLGVPTFSNVTSNMQRSQASMELMTSFTLARSEAGRRGVTVTICPSSDGATCSTDDLPNWNSGWIVFTDQDADRSIDSGTDTLIHTARFGNSSFSLTGSTPVKGGVALNGSGFPSATGTFNYCDKQESRTLALNFVGRIEHTGTGAGCP